MTKIMLQRNCLTDEFSSVMLVFTNCKFKEAYLFYTGTDAGYNRSCAHVPVTQSVFLLLCVEYLLGMKRCYNCSSPGLCKFSSCFEMYTSLIFEHAKQLGGEQRQMQNSN